MELKDFQQQVLAVLDRYLDALFYYREQSKKIEELRKDNPDLDIPVPDFTEKTWAKLKGEALLPRVRNDIPFSPRKDGIGRLVPSICFKIPTAGGKTLLAVNSLSQIMGKWAQKNSGFVLWIVPNEAIYSQTKRAFLDREHPYRQILDRAAAGKVKILEKNDSLNKRDIETHLCVMLLMLQSANRETKESLKLFRDRGNIYGFFPPTDDIIAHAEIINKIPNLDVYGDKDNLGAIVKDSLGNALRTVNPVVIMDEGHKGYSNLALRTLYGFNPCFVLELSATPKDRPRSNPPMYSNWLVDIRGTALDKEEMIKLPINVAVHGGDDWRACLQKSLERLDRLQSEADQLRSNSPRYIRPICLIQVERTGDDQRGTGFIHADDARDYLLRLGVHENQIAIKTAEKNELKDPENLDLLSPKSEIRFIITKQALQEGWDCPFAYILCSLAPATSQSAVTQLVGRILRQPDTIKTGYSSLDESYVFCHHTTTRDIITTIKAGLEQDGMSDLADEIRDVSDGTGDTLSKSRKLNRREKHRNIEIYLPIVNWCENGVVRPLDYEQDILYRLDWSNLEMDDVVEKSKTCTETLMTQVVRVGLKDDTNGKELLEITDKIATPIIDTFDPVYAVRKISDIVPNPWIARDIIGELMAQLKDQGFDDYSMGACEALIVDVLRQYLIAKRDQMAEQLFMGDVSKGRIQFKLRMDEKNWKMPDYIITQSDPNNQELRRDDGGIVEKSLFEAVYRDELNAYERSVACYLDGHKALQWWHRNVAKRQYGIQGWRKNRIYPDFIFAVQTAGEEEKVVILETKGDHLAANLDTEYKKKLLEKCAEAFCFDNGEEIGQLELVIDSKKTVTCALVYEESWKTGLAKLISEEA